jgi:hypothetical protein
MNPRFQNGIQALEGARIEAPDLPPTLFGQKIYQTDLKALIRPEEKFSRPSKVFPWMESRDGLGRAFIWASVEIAERQQTASSPIRRLKSPEQGPRRDPK